METPSSSPAQGGPRLKGGGRTIAPNESVRSDRTERSIATNCRPDYCRLTWKRGLQSGRRPLTAASSWQAGHSGKPTTSLQEFSAGADAVWLDQCCRFVLHSTLLP